MRTHFRLFLPVMLLVLSSACSGPQTPAPAAAPAAPQAEYQIDATIKDVMSSVVMPSADALWNAVASEVTAKGVIDHGPKNDKDWAELRHHAVALMEATNLMQMPGRLVARPGEKPDNPGIEETPESIKALLDADRASWIKFAHGLHDATAVTLKAIDAKDVTGLTDSGEGIDKACEACHMKYWYPHQFDKKGDAPATPAAAPSTGKTP